MALHSNVLLEIYKALLGWAASSTLAVCEGYPVPLKILAFRSAAKIAFGLKSVATKFKYSCFRKGRKTEQKFLAYITTPQIGLKKRVLPFLRCEGGVGDAEIHSKEEKRFFLVFGSLNTIQWPFVSVSHPNCHATSL